MVLVACRPPRGGRGLKFEPVTLALTQNGGRPPRGGRGLKFPTEYPNLSTL